MIIMVVDYYSMSDWFLDSKLSTCLEFEWTVQKSGQMTI